MGKSASKWMKVGKPTVHTPIEREKVQFMFMGEYNHTIDTKGRMIIPAKLRESLGDGFVVTRGLDGCLFVFPNETWTEFEAKLNALPMTDKKARQFSRFFLRGAITPEVDKQGRILIPAVLREAAGLEKEVTMIGMGNRVEIWNPQRLEENATFDDIDEIAEHMAELGI